MVVQLIMEYPTRSNSFILSHHLAPTIFRAFLPRDRVSGFQLRPLASKLKRTSANSSPVFCGSLGSAPRGEFSWIPSNESTLGFSSRDSARFIVSPANNEVIIISNDCSVDPRQDFVAIPRVE